MNSPSIVLQLERPYEEFTPRESTPREIVLAGLRWPTEYWRALAVRWLEQGVPLDTEIADLLLNLSEDRQTCSQRLRQRAFALSAKYLGENCMTS